MNVNARRQFASYSIKMEGRAGLDLSKAKENYLFVYLEQTSCFNVN